MKNNKGYTIIELIIVIAYLVISILTLAAIGFGAYVALHFIAKFW